MLGNNSYNLTEATASCVVQYSIGRGTQGEASATFGPPRSELADLYGGTFRVVQVVCG